MIKNSQGLTPLMFAAKNNYSESLKALAAENKSSINEEDKNCMTILQHILNNDDFKMANKLI